MDMPATTVHARTNEDTERGLHPLEGHTKPVTGVSRFRHWLQRALKPRRRVRPTGQGLIFMTLTLSIGFAALNTGNNLLYLILAMMLSLLSLSGILAELSIRRLEVSRIFPQDATAGERMYGLIRLYNPKRWIPVLGIRVDEYVRLPIECHSAFFPVVSAGEEQTCSVWYQFPKRGRVRLERLECWTSYPFGFFVRGLIRTVEAEVLVLPPVRAYAGQAQVQRAEQGVLPRPRRGQGDDFFELRPFQEGEDPRRIHWKSSARRQQLMLRESAEQQRNRVLITLDLQTVLPDEEAYEEALIVVASAAAFQLQRGAEVGVEAPGVTVPFDVGAAHLYRIRRALALAPRAAEAAEKPALPMRHMFASIIAIQVKQETAHDL